MSITSPADYVIRFHAGHGIFGFGPLRYWWDIKSTITGDVLVTASHQRYSRKRDRDDVATRFSIATGITIEQ